MRALWNGHGGRKLRPLPNPANRHSVSGIGAPPCFARGFERGAFDPGIDKQDQAAPGLLI